MGRSMKQQRTASRVAATAIAALALCTVSAPHGVAQTLTNPKPAARQAPKPAPAPVTAPVYGHEQADYWTVNTSLPSQYGAERPRPQPRSGESARAVPSERSPIDRVPLRDPAGSTIGFASGQTASSGRFTDGREVPGINPNTRAEDSYVGLSLTTRSSSKGFIVPVPTPWSRPE
jgi:hypothetical protein